MTSVYLGIDPGANGGMAALDHVGNVPVMATLSKMTPRDRWEWIAQYRARSRYTDRSGKVDLGCAPFAVIEKVGGYVSGAGFKAGSSAMFNFGYGAGALEAFLIAAAIPYELVTPQVWQRALGIQPRRRVARGKTTTSDGKPPETESQWKGRLRERAQQLFPSVKVTLPIADSLLLAEYVRRQRSPKQVQVQ